MLPGGRRAAMLTEPYSVGSFSKGLIHTMFHTQFKTSGGAGFDYYGNPDQSEYSGPN